MNFCEFEKELSKIQRIYEYEKNLDAIGADYPPMSSVAANLLEQIITGRHQDDGLITWWMYALDSGKDSGVMLLNDDTRIEVQTKEDLFAVLTNDEVYRHFAETEWEQLELEM